MNTLLKLIKSRTFWTIVIMFLIGGIDAITQFIPADAKVFILGALSALAAYFKLTPSQKY